MKKKRERRKRIIFFSVVILIVAAVWGILHGREKADLQVREQLQSQTWQYDGEQDGTYTAYIDALRSEGKLVAAQGDAVRVDAVNFVASQSDKVEITEAGLVSQAGGKVTYEINVPSSGMYNIEVGYCPVADSPLAILRGLKINDAVPFKGVERLVFDRMWDDESKAFLMRTDRNEGFPTQIQKEEFASVKLESTDKTVVGPYRFYLEKGKNIISLEAVQSEMILSYISLVPATEVLTYEQYMSAHASAKKIDAAQLGDKGYIMKQAEDAYVKSSSVILPQNDRSSAATIPHHSSNIVLNTIGGSSWSKAGTSITWQMEVPEAGLYRIATRFMQAENRDFYSAREIKINGEVPFEEAGAVKFYYDPKFQVEYLGDENGAFYFYLDKGINTITMSVTLGELTYAYEQAQISLRNFNTLHRELVAIMGNNPDTYRDYDIVGSIPDMVDIMSKEYSRLNSIIVSMGDTLTDNTRTREVSKFCIQLEKLVKKPGIFAKELSNFSENISALGNWMLKLDEQPLQLDYILICGEGTKLPKKEANFFQNFAHGFGGFIGSFTNDYRIASDDTISMDKKKIVVWISTSTRDQYDIVQRMINNAFKDRDFSVELKMVGAGTVMPATLTGKGPDAAIQLDFSMPTNFAYRNAGYDLTVFPDFEEVAGRFAPGAMEYFEYNGGIYAIPDQMSFPVLFYRSDILAELGLEVPNTWDELIGLLPYLQSQNMSIYFTPGSASLGSGTSTSSTPISTYFATRLFQNGVELYKNGGKQTNLDSLEALLTFKNWTEYYTKQSFQYSVNLVHRFRTGDIPIFIDDYTVVNSLKFTAPEIEGCWDIAPVPATVKEDGSLDRSTACTVGSCMIIKTTVEANDSAQEAWEFLKWWTSKEVQIQYAEEQKSILGDGADFPLANVEAVKTRAVEKGTLDTITEAISWLKGIPQVPGGYIVGREINNAFVDCINNYSNPVETLYSKIQMINDEIAGKRKEFGSDEVERGNK